MPELSSREVTMMGLLAPLPVEVREKRDGRWIVSYPDPSWIPCAPVCHFGSPGYPFRGHSHNYKQTYVESYHQPGTFDGAMAWARELAGPEGEIKRFPYTSRGKAEPDEVRVIEREPEDDE